MAKIIYDTGEMLAAARYMEKELDSFKKNHKKLSKRICDTRKHTDYGNDHKHHKDNCHGYFDGCTKG